jgi:hypothetical protein
MSETLNLVNPNDVLSCKYEISRFPDGQQSIRILELIYEDGVFYNQTTLTEIRQKLKI